MGALDTGNLINTLLILKILLFCFFCFNVTFSLNELDGGDVPLCITVINGWKFRNVRLLMSCLLFSQ